MGSVITERSNVNLTDPASYCMRIASRKKNCQAIACTQHICCTTKILIKNVGNLTSLCERNKKVTAWEGPAHEHIFVRANLNHELCRIQMFEILASLSREVTR